MNRKPYAYKASALTIAPIPYGSLEQESNLRITVLQTAVLATSPSGHNAETERFELSSPEGLPP